MKVCALHAGTKNGICLGVFPALTSLSTVVIGKALAAVIWLSYVTVKKGCVSCDKFSLNNNYKKNISRKVFFLL